MSAKAEDIKKAVGVLVDMDIPDIEVKEVVESRDGSYLVTAISTKEGTECHQCGKRIEKPYGHGEWVTIRHLPIFGKDVYIRIRMPKYQCTDCDGNPTTTQRVVPLPTSFSAPWPSGSPACECYHDPPLCDRAALLSAGSAILADT